MTAMLKAKYKQKWRKGKQAKVLQFSRKTNGEIGIPDFLFLPTGNEKP